MIFPSIKIDSVVQVDDLFRANLAGTTTHEGSEVDKIEMRIGAADPVVIFEPATGKDKYHLDWQFDAEAEHVMDFIFTYGSETRTVSKTVKAISAINEKLFSNDEMLIQLEPDVFNLLPAGRSSFVYAHRMSQAKIIRELNEDGHEIEIENIFDKEEVSFWSRYMALAFIFESNITTLDDIHTQKKSEYATLMSKAKARAVISIDEDANGTSDSEIKAESTQLTYRLVKK